MACCTRSSSSLSTRVWGAGRLHGAAAWWRTRESIFMAASRPTEVRPSCRRRRHAHGDLQRRKRRWGEVRRRWWAKKEGEGLTSAGSGHLWPRRGLPWRIPANKRGCKTLASGGAADLHGGNSDADQGDLAGVLRAAGARQNRAAWVATAARERGVRGEERRRRGFGWVRVRERVCVCVLVRWVGWMDGCPKYLVAAHLLMAHQL